MHLVSEQFIHSIIKLSFIECQIFCQCSPYIVSNSNNLIGHYFWHHFKDEKSKTDLHSRGCTSNKLDFHFSLSPNPCLPTSPHPYWVTGTCLYNHIKYTLGNLLINVYQILPMVPLFCRILCENIQENINARSKHI